MKIITISREFGSGGRELGKRLSEAMKLPYYDHQIMEKLFAEGDFSQSGGRALEGDFKAFYPSTIARGFYRSNYALLQSMQLMAAERSLLRRLAEEGDCVIVGRAADLVLADFHPFRIFVCTDDAARILRCREKAGEDEKLSDREILRNCRALDRGRSAYRKNFSEQKWGDARGFDLCINTSGKKIKSLIPGLLLYINSCYVDE
ncbi:MAG: cytidylate kinase-like family protein [Bacillota bacterium]|nr:cytidylate kinase-like family protein [Bacillota bacterium]